MHAFILLNLAIRFCFDPEQTFAQYQLLPSEPKELHQIFKDLSECLIVDPESFKNYSQDYPTRTLMDLGTFNQTKKLVLFGYKENFVSLEIEGQVYILFCSDSALINIKIEEQKMKAIEAKDRENVKRNNEILSQIFKWFLGFSVAGWMIAPFSSVFNWPRA